MNTFINIQLESVISDLTRAQLMQGLERNLSLHERINKRGGREQFSALLLLHYYPNENILKRKCKGTRTSGGEFFCKY